MEKVKSFFVKYHNTIAFWVCAIVSIGLIIGGFCAPPLGEISNSVLIAVGELFGFATLGVLPSAIKEGRSFKATYGDASVEIGSKNE